MEINSSELIEKLSKEIAYLECLCYIQSFVTNSDVLMNSEEVQAVLSSLERFVNDKR